MPDKQLLQTIALLENIDKSIGLTPSQRKLLRSTKLKLRFGWVPQGILHLSFAVLAVLSYLHLSHLSHIQTVCAAADAVSVALSKAESSQRGYLLTGGKDIYITDYDNYTKLVVMRMAYLCTLIPHSDSNKSLCMSLARDIGSKLEEMSSTLKDARSGNTDRAMQTVRTDEGLQLTRTIEAELGKIRVESTTSRETGPAGCLTGGRPFLSQLK